MLLSRYLKLKVIGRFGLVGVVATLVHLMVSMMTLWLGANIYLANILGFLVAFGVSFLGHSRLTFPEGDRSHWAWARFFLVALMGFGLNNLVLLLSDGKGMEWLRLVVAIFVAPLGTFLLSALWVFARRDGRG
jgi:Predicted membrane protein